eukprot:4610282-Prymnesium_polylepis.1
MLEHLSLDEVESLWDSLHGASVHGSSMHGTAAHGDELPSPMSASSASIRRAGDGAFMDDVIPIAPELPSPRSAAAARAADAAEGRSVGGADIPIAPETLTCARDAPLQPAEAVGGPSSDALERMEAMVAQARMRGEGGGATAGASHGARCGGAERGGSAAQPVGRPSLSDQ